MSDLNPPYRPLNVRDALSYLDQVKMRFVEQPEVYNRFLDVMKEFKGQIIDTPGVIDRVSTLFRGHPSLIQGFNTFLPPGYRIECLSGDGEQDGLISVTTPSGTVSHVPGGFTAAMDKMSNRDRETRPAARPPAEPEAKRSAPAVPAPARAPEAASFGPPTLPPLRSEFSDAGRRRTGPSPPSTAGRGAKVQSTNGTTSVAPGPLPMPTGAPIAPSGPSTPSAAQFLASGLASNSNPSPSNRAPGNAPILEFNHAIAFVNKIKMRFSEDQDTYKQFLEILQTYQRDTKDIAEVYEQVTKLFHLAPDLIAEFKKFLPENGSSAFSGMGFGSFVQAASNTPQSVDKGGVKRSAKDGKEVAPVKRRRGPAGDGKVPRKKNTKADSPDGDDGETSLALPPGGPQTLASPEEVAFFDKVKKFVDDKVTYHEFLKLINLFVQDMIDVPTLVDRADFFIGNSGDIWVAFKKMVGADDPASVTTNTMGARGGYGFGGMINADSKLVENIPMLDRVKPDLSGHKVKSYGPSYRKLPSSEVNLQCTGRDAMCWEVLNDEWVSHPTWAAEDAAPFMAHKKNAYEEALHKSEEERHEYDYHIEANLRTISILEPLNNKIQTMDPEERAHFNLKAGLGGQSKSIYQRIIKKVYGKEIGPDVIRALHDNPATSLPIVLERLKAKDEEWKKAQREWNRVWREQDAKNFYKALDHQGVAFKASDKKVLSAKSLISEIEARKREQSTLRATVRSMPYRGRPQFSFHFTDVEVLKDVVKLVISYLDRMMGTLNTQDKDRIENHLRDLVPLLFMFNKEEFDAEFGDAEHGTPDDGEASDDSDGDVAMAEDDEASNLATGKRGKKGGSAADLRKRLLKSVGEKEGRDKRGSTMTPGPEDVPNGENGEARSVEGTPMTENGEREETPIPAPADPEAVAEAVEKDKVTADASEQTWVQIDTPGDSRLPSEEPLSKKDAEIKARVSRKANFFTNSHYYVLLRLIEIMYSRLKRCKDLADQLAKEKQQPINPIAIKLGLADPETQNFGIEAGENPAQYYYQNLLSLAEKLFENELDVNTFEETLRFMFGTKAYILFTLDRVVAAIVKQTQTILGDMKSQELFALLQRDRAADKTTVRQQIAYRMQAESVVGSDDNLYKVEYHDHDETLTVQLLGREDLTIDDAETARDKWRQYIESFALVHATEGLPHRVDKPFLQRNLTDIPEDIAPNSFDTHSGLEIKIALGNYRMFFTPETEDFFHRKRSMNELAELEKSNETATAAAKDRLAKFVNDKINPPAEAAQASGREGEAQAVALAGTVEVKAEEGKEPGSAAVSS
ncbi:hypothetical protein BD324DRAFT_636920 [Kockovaella imperatae]|uniref:Histone deacetylase interacting domain-containing protein n=1 Tax=Kockovaella imperatae TaxID=4999 RepID=A0A1Y1U807_9TREE|nr:hypothetical protein BD324DRAFT_636920 [Kockovaella imperatae]ORX34170.1 hypothetical protein BD324DRAFT_636920 [Kockovaella imperatae]